MSETPSLARRCTARAVQLPRLMVAGVLAVYHVALSPWLGPACRFAPTCSAYMATAVRRYGVLRGGWMGIRRLLRCHPYHAGGWDPVV